jgi:hypothetical protein
MNQKGVVRSLILGGIIAGGVLTLSVSAAQQPAAEPKTLEVDKVKDNLFVLRKLPVSGGNTAVFVTASGVTLVDTKNPGWGQPILDAVKQLTDKPVVRMQDAKKAGKTADDVVKTWKTPAKYTGYATATETRVRSDAQVVWDETK